MLEKSINGLIMIGITTLCFGFLGQSHWLLDLPSHFRVYYLFFFLVLSIVSLLFRLRLQGAASGAFALFILITLVRFYWPPKPKPGNANGLKICSINLLSSNGHYDLVKKYLDENDFDMVVFQELNDSWENALYPLRNEYPHLDFRARDDNFGIGILSKLPFTAIKTQELNPGNLPTLIATVSFKNKPLTLIATHPLPPVGTKDFRYRNEQFVRLNELVKSLKTPVLLIGDLNCTDFSPNFNLLIRETTLTDTRLGRGVQPTWKASSWLLSVPIDHAWVTEEILTLARDTGPDVGSDHLPIQMEIDWK